MHSTAKFDKTSLSKCVCVCAYPVHCIVLTLYGAAVDCIKYSLYRLIYIAKFLSFYIYVLQVCAGPFGPHDQVKPSRTDIESSMFFGFVGSVAVAVAACAN